MTTTTTDARHATVAQEFAVSGGERFTAAQGWSALSTGEPHLVSARVALRCRSREQIPVGSSMLVVSEVVDIHTGPAVERATPMIYHDRTFRAVGDPLIGADTHPPRAHPPTASR